MPESRRGARSMGTGCLLIAPRWPKLQFVRCAREEHRRRLRDHRAAYRTSWQRRGCFGLPGGATEPGRAKRRRGCARSPAARPARGVARASRQQRRRPSAAFTCFRLGGATENHLCEIVHPCTPCGVCSLGGGTPAPRERLH